MRRPRLFLASPVRNSFRTELLSIRYCYRTELVCFVRPVLNRTEHPFITADEQVRAFSYSVVNVL